MCGISARGREPVQTYYEVPGRGNDSGSGYGTFFLLGAIFRGTGP
jgi:hypothetical protein